MSRPLPLHAGDLGAVDNDDPKSRNPFTWHLKTADKGSKKMAIKNHFIAMVGEYVGTTLFMIFALGGTNVALIPSTSITGDATAGQDGSQASTANTSNLLYIALCFGFSLAVNVWIFFRVSGGLFNPAVSLGMVLVGAVTPLRGVLLTISQILGGITGAAIISALTPGTLNVRTSLGGGTSVVQGLFIEMFLTALLMLSILLLAAEKTKATFIAPIGIGLALFVAELLGVYYTGGSLNPARSFGPAVVLHTFNTYHWIYWVGPFLGAIIASGFYKMLKWLQFETVLGEDGADTTRPTTPSGTRTNEKASGGATVTGPGMDDYLTSAEVPQSGWKLEDHNEEFVQRLDRMEALLLRLAERDNSAAPRTSNSTIVADASPKVHHHHHTEAAQVPSTNQGEYGNSYGAYNASQTVPIASNQGQYGAYATDTVSVPGADGQYQTTTSQSPIHGHDHYRQ